MRRNYFLLPYMLCFLLSFAQFRLLTGQVTFPSGSAYKYLKGNDGLILDANWMDPGFDDSAWNTGNAPIRYGDGDGGTELTDMQFNYSVVFMRTTFSASHVDSLKALMATINYDDGFVIWINGERVLSRYAPSNLSSSSFATENHESGTPELFELDPGQVSLIEGVNTLAIQGFNVSLESSDFLFDIGINAQVIVPIFQDTVGLAFSMPSGFYDSLFYLDITPADTAWDVVYTLDGSNPQNTESAVVSHGGARVLIDPESYGVRPSTPAVMVRASTTANDAIPSYSESRSFIFLEKVLTQQYPGGAWPDQIINEQVIDLGMDERIINDPVYQELMIPSLLDIPTLSVITDLDHLFDAETGIYVNAAGHGHAWERECSVELMNPDGSRGFHVNAGLRIRGGWSRHPDFPKHAFRLFFRSDYGDAKLNFPLFGTEGTDRYDKIDVRTAQNYAWSNGDERNTFLRDVFSRDAQRDMGQPYTRSRYYHLYLSGMYWGLYQTQERSEARYAADYLGGNTNDYDVIKVNTEDWVYRIEATDGDFTGWHSIWNMCNAGFKSNANYFRLEGKDEMGIPVPGGRVYVDIDNLIDYMLTIFYTGNFDAPTSTFGWNKGPNNFFAINNRLDRSRGFTFYNHDAEHSMFTEAIDPGTGLFEDRVNLTLRTDEKHMEVDYFDSFHPQWLHQKLAANMEYRIRFMDRAHLHLTGKGALTPEKNLERLNSRAAEIDLAVIAESARWGDARPWNTTPLNKNDHWNPQVQIIRNDFIPVRTTILIDQLKEAKLFSNLESPVVTLQGEVVYERYQKVLGNSTLVIENKNGAGIICYTTDGTDPRAVRGGISQDATISGESRIELSLQSSGVIMARIQNQGTWSALKEVYLLSTEEDYSNLVITELHYHPEPLIFEGDTISGKDLEFMEFKNIGDEVISLGGLVLDSAVYFEFPGNAVLAPDQFYVVASKPSAFYLRYGRIASGNYQKNLSNGGEEILLRDNVGNQVIHLIYSDNLPWPAEADGVGYSLVSTDFEPTGDPSDPAYWKRSYNLGGSPFDNEPFPLGQELNSDEIGQMLIYPNPAFGEFNILLPENSRTEKIEISLFGIEGNLVYKDTFSHMLQLHISDLALKSGMYVVRIQTATRSYTDKIVFQ